MFAAGCIHDDMFADLYIRYGGGIEMVELANFGETYTDNIFIHEWELYRIGAQVY